MRRLKGWGAFKNAPNVAKTLFAERAHVRLRVLLLTILVATAGCTTPDPEAVVEAGAPDADPPPPATDPPAAETSPEEGPRRLVFNGTAGPGARMPGGDTTGARTRHAFDVDAGTSYLRVGLDSGEAPGALDAVLRDPWGRIQCTAAPQRVAYGSGTGPLACTAPVPANLTTPRAWTVDVGGGAPGSVEETSYVLEITLHPHGARTAADGLDGADASLRFRVADTGAESGFEPTVGVLPDGTIFAQMDLQTMRSRDDGLTWEDASPDPRPVFSADPMMRVDPWSERVYVDHLTIACSMLWWSDDAARSWTTNPAACGLPVNDHQKIAVGPSPIAASPLPVLYYAWYSFTGFVWVARSLDGGFTFTTASVFTPAEGDPVNTGPVETDRDGGVYVPTYFCDDGGWVGVGVSHDHGASFRTVRVSDEDGPCDQVDPSIAVDAAGTVYVAYVRPTGVKVAVSEDRGLTWGEPYAVHLPQLASFLHVDAVAGDAGRLALAYRATADGAGGPSGVDGWAAWRVYAAFVTDADTPHPDVRNAAVGGEDEVNHRGPFCLGFYPPCPPGERVVGEFLDTATTPDGRLVVAYDDACRDACPTPADARHRIGAVAVLQEGPRLYAERAPWA